jgi:hypothetical protein
MYLCPECIFTWNNLAVSSCHNSHGFWVGKVNQLLPRQSIQHEPKHFIKQIVVWLNIMIDCLCFNFFFLWKWRDLTIWEWVEFFFSFSWNWTVLKIIESSSSCGWFQWRSQEIYGARAKNLSQIHMWHNI